MKVFNTPRALLVGNWGFRGLGVGFTDALYRDASWEESLGGQTQELVERRIGAFYRQGHRSVFEFMGAQFLVTKYSPQTKEVRRSMFTLSKKGG